MLRVIVAGVTGWVGKPLAEEIQRADDLRLVGAIARGAAGQTFGDVTIVASAEDALADPADVFVDYTSAAVVKMNVLTAVRKRVHVVVGSSGLTDADFASIHDEAVSAGVGVLAVGNFAITAALLQKFAVEAAKYLPTWEVIDSAYAGKMDAPSGTARELASKLSRVRTPEVEVPIENTVGLSEARGAEVNGSRIHSIRLPGYTIGLEVRFGRLDERLTISYDGGTGAGPYIAGTMLAIRKVPQFTGVVRGMDQIL
ncbi:MAG TPA: 4-hydroxy-tetrahydrodipicolinate reductase [Thermoanaerobaculia bacterium]|nr:4-hydroxy-tetrahydrodipicolinate reductase [Thermoanaerobaculia bacterium]